MERLLDLARASWGSTASRSAAQPDPARRVPLRARDHLPGLRAAHLRQRQLRARARQGAGRDRLGGFVPAREQPRRARRAGARHRLVTYVEGTGIGPYEGAKVTRADQRQGDASPPASARRARATTPPSRRSSPSSSASTCAVEVVTGDTDQFHWGTGTFASRGAVVAGNACHAAASRCAARSSRSPPRSSRRRGGPRAGGRQGARRRRAVASAITLGELAVRANPMRGAVKPGHRARPRGDRPTSARRCGATASRRARHGRRGRPRRCGDHPALRRGARLRHGAQPADPRGPGPRRRRAGHRQRLLRAAGLRPSTGSCSTPRFMDYLLPTAARRAADRDCTTRDALAAQPARHQGRGGGRGDPGGRGCSRQAVEDALGPGGPEILEIPLSPNQLFELIHGRPAGEDA
jgi:aerobic carbon-monoxide dehydrogenase large subunit